MAKTKYILIALAVLSFVSPIGFGEVSDKPLNKLLELSGITAQVPQFPGQIKQGMMQSRQQQSNISEADFNEMLLSIEKSVSTTEIISTIRSSLKASLNEKDVKHLLAWYESPLGKEITQAENNASKPEAYQQMMQEAQTLLSNTERVEMAKKMDKLTGATNMAMKLQNQISVAIYSAMMAAMQPEAPLNLEPIKAQIEATSAQSRASIEQVVTLSLVYSYKGIDMNKLKKYEAFLSNSSSTKFYKTVMDSMGEGFESSISRLANAFAMIFKNKKKQG